MPDYDWVKIGRSWHAVVGGEMSVVGQRNKARCGRHSIEIPLTKDMLPLGSKSCESCLRLIQHDEEK